MTQFSSLALNEITKRFGDNVALNNVDFRLEAGEVHALLGENGAGKSTLMRILAGIYTDFDGAYVKDGDDIRPQDPGEALGLGIGMIHQELSIIPELSVAENLFLGRMPCHRLGLVDWTKAREQALALLAQVNLDHIDVSLPLEHYPLGIQQIIEILRVVHSGAEILIMDEPTSALSPGEIDHLMDIIQQLRGEGRGIIYISHFIDEVLRIADRITVLRDGHHIATLKREGTDAAELIRLILGHDPATELPALESQQSGRTLMRVDDLTSGTFENMSFEIEAGEIVGLYGAVGAGHFELAKALFGVMPVRGGRVEIDGTPLPAGYQPQAAIRHGIAYASESRRQSLFLEDAIYKNVTLPHLKVICGTSPARDREIEIARTAIVKTNVQPADPELAAGKLSGGNQQKVAIARWLTVQPKILIVSEPTRGMDVGAKADVLGILRDLSSDGIAVLVVSSEPETVMAVSDRIITMARGKRTGELARGSATQDSLLSLVST